MTKVKLTDKKMVPCNWLKTDGTPGTAENVTVTSSDETVAKGEYKDGNVWMTNVGPGKATITVDGDTNPGQAAEDVKHVINTFEWEVEGEFAEHLQFGDAVDQPAA